MTRLFLGRAALALLTVACAGFASASERAEQASFEVADLVRIAGDKGSEASGRPARPKAEKSRKERLDDYRMISSRVKAYPQGEEAIRPSAIRHSVDEIHRDGRLDQRYNYIDYEFEHVGVYCRARTYLDDINEVAIYGPFAARGDLRKVDNPGFRAAVMTYLKRRFHIIKELGADGYVTIWTRPRP